jgi:hypothetical protein
MDERQSEGRRWLDQTPGVVGPPFDEAEDPQEFEGVADFVCAVASGLDQETGLDIHHSELHGDQTGEGSAL